VSRAHLTHARETSSPHVAEADVVVTQMGYIGLIGAT